MPSLSAHFDLSGRVALVVGGTRIALERARLLLDAGAAVRLVSPTSTPEIEAFVSRHPVDWRRRPLSPLDLHEVALAFVFTGDRHEDEIAARAARVARVPVSVFDRPDLSDFVVPTVQAHPARLAQTGHCGLSVV